MISYILCFFFFFCPICYEHGHLLNDHIDQNLLTFLIFYGNVRFVENFNFSSCCTVFFLPILCS